MEETLESETDRRKATEKLNDELFDYLIYAYVMGVESANKDLGTNLEPDMVRMHQTIHERTAGKDYSQRLNEYAFNNDYSKLSTLAETEFVRTFNQGILDVGKEAKAKTKTWCTMMDDRVRDTHDYLEGVTVPFDAEFVTYDGDHAQAPHGFTQSANNVNCRCWLELNN